METAQNGSRPIRGTPQQRPNSRKAHAWRRVESVWGWKEVCKKVGLLARGMNLES